jgi:hypothetical protein
MSEPITSAAGGFALGKAIPIIGPVLAAIVVMSLATPESKKEWVAALTSTVALSLFGGAAVLSYFELTAWATSFVGLMGITGVCFVCGLPAWLLVRAAFKWMNTRKDKDIAELAADLKEIKDNLSK